MTQKADTARLDIIMPVYNTADYLDQCLQSIADQTLTDWHLIIVDDGSTDGSPQICDRWAEKDSRITVVHKENTGQADSRNIALDMCRAPYVGFADSDDWLEPDMFEFLVGNVEKYDADIAVCGHYLEYVGRSVCKNTDEGVELIDNDTAQRLLIDNRIPSYIWQMVFRRECLEGRIAKLKSHEDYAVLPHWYSRARRVALSKRPLYHYRMRRGSIVNTHNPAYEYTFIEAEEHRLEFYRNTPYERLLEERMAARCVRVAKHIARLDTSPTLISISLRVVREKLEALVPKDRRRLRGKERMLGWMLMHSIRLFMVYLMMEKRLLGKKGKARGKVYFK